MLVYNPNSNNIAYYNGQPIPKQVAGIRHEIYAKVMLGQPLTQAERDILRKHIAPVILKQYTGK